MSGGVGSTEPPRSAGAGFAGAGAGNLALNLRHELVGLGGIVERNIYLTKRYLLWDVAFLVWTIANTLTIVSSHEASASPRQRRTRSRRSCSSAA